MIRKLILLALASTLAKKYFDQKRAGSMQSPFPTSSRPPEGHGSV